MGHDTDLKAALKVPGMKERVGGRFTPWANTRRRPALVGAALSLGVLAGCCSDAKAQFATQWVNNTIGNWLVPAYWDSGVPDGSRVAYINNGGQCLVTQAGATVAQLYVGVLGQSSILSISPAGTLTVNGGLLAVERSTLELTNGGKIYVVNAPGVGQAAKIYGYQGTTGSARIFGPGSYLSAGNLYVGTDGVYQPGPGSVSVEAGGRIDSGRDQIVGSSVVVTGAGSVWQTPDYVTVRNSTVTVSSGASASALYASFGNSTLNVTGANSVYTVTSSSGLVFGNTSGPGYGYITAGGRLSSGAVIVGSGTTSSVPVDPSGYVTVDGSASSWTLSAGLTIGGLPPGASPGYGNGSVTISNGAGVSAPAFDVGQNLNYFGSLDVNGFNSRLTGVVFDSFVGDIGQGSVSVRGGGKLTTNRLFLGNAAGALGLVSVSDIISSVTNNGSIYIGNAGSGTLQVTNRGTVFSKADALIGATAGGSGSVYVDGSGSGWTVTNVLGIGGNAAAAGGTGILRVYNNASVSAAGIRLYGGGTLEVSGPVTLTGPITATGGLLRTMTAATLTNNFTLGDGGLRVYCPADNTDTTLSGTLAGTGDLSASADTSGTTLTLTGPVSYSGATTISALTLVIANDSAADAFGPGDIAVGTDGVLALGRSDFVLLANHISGEGRVEQRGPGQTYLTGVVEHTGGTTVTDGALYAANTGAPTAVGVGDIVVNAPGSFVFARDDDVDVANNISGGGMVFQSGFGTTRLSGILSYTGDTYVDSGVLVLQSPLRPVSGGLVANGPSGNSPVISFEVPASGEANVVVGEFSTIYFPAAVDVLGSVRVAASPRDVNKAEVLVTSNLLIEMGQSSGDSSGSYSGSMDMGTADLIIRGAANPENSSVEAIRAYLTAWTISGGSVGLGSSSTSLAALMDVEAPDAPTALGMFINDAGGGVAYFSSYDGVGELGAEDVIVKYTYFGDTNLDGVVDGRDLAAVIEGFSNGLSGWQHGDFDYSGGETTIEDVQAFLAAVAWFEAHPDTMSLGDGSDGSMSAVPEAGSVVGGLAPVALLGRRRRIAAC